MLSAQGKTIKDITQTYQVHRVTVLAWITKWEQHAAPSLYDPLRSGWPGQLTLAEQGLAQQYFKGESRSPKAAVDWIAQQTEKSISILTLKRLAKKARLR